MMRISILAIGGVLTMATLMISGCTQSPTQVGTDPTEKNQRTLTRYRFARVLMGSRCEILLEAPSEPEAARAAGMAFDEIRRIELVLSDYNPDAEAMRVMRLAPGLEHPISGTLLEVLLVARDIHIASAGAFDPTVGAYTHLWRAAARNGQVPTRQALDVAQAQVGFDHLTINPLRRTVRFDRPGMILDFGGIGKGYAAQAGIELLRELGYRVACIDMGGDLQLGDPPSDSPRGWRVEIITGIDQTRTRYLHNTGIATSGDLERYYEHEGVRYSHIIDPRTGLGITERRAATVIAPDATIADALASVISVTGKPNDPQLVEAYPGAECTLVVRPLDDD